MDNENSYTNYPSYSNRELLCDMGFDDAVVFENPDYDSAIIGITNTDQVVYDYDKMVEHLMVNDNMEQLEAMEFIDFNSSYYQGYPYPLILYGVYNYE